MPILSRRYWIKSTAATVLLTQLPQFPARPADHRRDLAAAAARGRAFLASLFDPELDLLPEYRGSDIYWLYHDNYLAAKVLKRSHPELARRIERAIRGQGIRRSGKIEILFDEAQKPLPFRQFQLLVVKQIGRKQLKTERAGERPMKGWEEYADLLLLSAIALAKSEPARARRHFDAAQTLWDGQGFSDRVAQLSRQYATYKLALALIAATKLNIKPPNREAVLAALLAKQASDGGWITDYDAKDRPLGRANVETSSLAVLSLTRLGAPERP